MRRVWAFDRLRVRFGIGVLSRGLLLLAFTNAASTAGSSIASFAETWEKVPRGRRGVLGEPKPAEVGALHQIHLRIVHGTILGERLALGRQAPA